MCIVPFIFCWCCCQNKQIWLPCHWLRHFCLRPFVCVCLCTLSRSIIQTQIGWKAFLLTIKYLCYKYIHIFCYSFTEFYWKIASFFIYSVHNTVQLALNIQNVFLFLLFCCHHPTNYNIYHTILIKCLCVCVWLQFGFAASSENLNRVTIQIYAGQRILCVKHQAGISNEWKKMDKLPCKQNKYFVWSGILACRSIQLAYIKFV